MMKTKTLFSKVVGVTFEGRQKILAQMQGFEIIQLRPEPDNKYDGNAIAVWVAFPPEAQMEPAHIGYIPKELASEIAPHMDGEFFIGEVDHMIGGFQTREGENASLGCVICVEIPDDE